MEEHLRPKKSFIPNIDFNRFASVRWFVDVLLELIIQAWMRLVTNGGILAFLI